MSCTWIAKLDVVLNGVIKKEYSLKYGGEILEQGVNFIVAHIASTKGHLTCIYIPKTLNKTDKGCFARSTWPHDGTRGACRNRKADIFKNLPVIVAKGNMRKFNVVRIRFLQTFSLVHCGSGENGICLFHCNFKITQNS